MKRLLVLLCCACSILRAQETLSLEAISADKSIWPVEVMVVVDHKLPVIIGGKVVKTLKIDPGTMYKVKTISPAGVTVYALGGPKTFPAAETDMIARAAQIKAHQEALAAATPTPTPVPKTARRPSAEPAATGAPNAMSEFLSGELVSLNGGKLEPFEAAKLGRKKYFAIYFSASWCPPCREFTPSLVQWYKRRQADSDKFDVIFVSRDRSEADMATYMAEDRMEWPAVLFSKRDSTPLSAHRGRGIPDLVIVDENGSVLSSSYQGGQYVGPMKALQYLDKLLKDS